MTNTDQTISTILAPLHRRDFMAGAVATGLSAAIGSAPARAPANIGSQTHTPSTEANPRVPSGMLVVTMTAKSAPASRWSAFRKYILFFGRARAYHCEAQPGTANR
jgi:hypothetical protein